MNGNDISWHITPVYIYTYIYIQASMFRSTSPWCLPRNALRPCWYKGVPGVKLLNPYDGLRWSGVFIFRHQGCHLDRFFVQLVDLQLPRNTETLRSSAPKEWKLVALAHKISACCDPSPKKAFYLWSNCDHSTNLKESGTIGIFFINPLSGVIYNPIFVLN